MKNFIFLDYHIQIPDNQVKNYSENIENSIIKHSKKNLVIPQLYKPYSLSKYNFGLALFWILKGLTKRWAFFDKS